LIPMLSNRDVDVSPNRRACHGSGFASRIISGKVCSAPCE
jgi:hypothetical protein